MKKTLIIALFLCVGSFTTGCLDGTNARNWQPMKGNTMQWEAETRNEQNEQVWTVNGRLLNDDWDLLWMTDQSWRTGTFFPMPR